MSETSCDLKTLIKYYWGYFLSNSALHKESITENTMTVKRLRRD